jgi:hypothetical protein
VNAGTVTFTVLNGGNPVGTATTSGPVSNGTASVSYTLPGGTDSSTYTIQAVYNASTDFTGSSDSSHTLTINGGSTVTTASSAAATFSASNRPVTLNASVTSTAGTVNGGTVTFSVFQGATQIGAFTSPASVSNGAASATYTLPGGTSAGTYTIVASYAGVGSFTSSGDSTHTLTVSQAAQAITFGAIPQQTVGVPLTLTATASSGLAVSYASTTTSVCTVSSSTATFLQPGNCSITASQPGNTNYSAATSVTQSFNVVPVNVTSSVSVSGGGLVYNRITHTGTETITITNTSGATLNGPLELLLVISNPSVTASNATGTYLGSPFWTSAGSLAPGASATITVQFSYALGATFTLTPGVYSGGI